MDVIYGLIPGMILLGLLAVGVFFLGCQRTGSFDDMEGEARRILMDDDLPPPTARSKKMAVRKRLMGRRK